MTKQRFKPKKTRRPGPKRDRLIRYLKELVKDEKTLAVLSPKRMERIRILYELPECVVDECINEARNWWWKLPKFDGVAA